MQPTEAQGYQTDLTGLYSNYTATLLSTFLQDVGSCSVSDQLFTHKKSNKNRIFYTATILVSKLDLYYVRLKIFVWEERWWERKERGELGEVRGISEVNNTI
jgi:hypothetical protein